MYGFVTTGGVIWFTTLGVIWLTPGGVIWFTTGLMGLSGLIIIESYLACGHFASATYNAYY